MSGDRDERGKGKGEEGGRHLQEVQAGVQHDVAGHEQEEGHQARRAGSQLGLPVQGVEGVLSEGATAQTAWHGTVG